MSTYTVKYNRTTNHIDGIAVRTQSTGADDNSGVVGYYAESTCGALTRGWFANGFSSDDLAEVLEEAGYGDRKLCKRCEKAANQALGL